MKIVALMSLRRAWVRIVCLAVGCGVFVFVVGLSYASIDQNAIRSLMESLPPVLKVIVGTVDLASPAGYLGVAFVHPVVLAAMGALVVSMATTPARDRESGAAELLLSRPLAPWRWLAGMAIALAVGLVAVAAGAYLGAVTSVATVHDLGGVSTASLLLVTLNALLVFAAAAGISLLIAVFSRTAGHAVGWAAGYIVLAYAINYLAMLWSVARPLGGLSIFYRYDPGMVLRTGHVPTTPVWALAITAVVTTVAAHVAVQRREPLVT